MIDSTKLPKVDINAIAADLNNKMDKDGVNASCPVVISRTANSQGGVVEIWSDGYCVQSGVVNSGDTVTFDVPYKDTNYILTSALIDSTSGNTIRWTEVTFRDKKNTGFYLGSQGVSQSFRAEGYIR